MPDFKKNLHQKRRHFTKRNLLVSVGVVIVVVTILISKSYYDTYHDRPLAQGLQYVGRDYKSGCLIFYTMCFGFESENLYYATDTNPDDVANLFPNWVLETSKQGSQQLWDGTSVSGRGYSLIDREKGLHTGYDYIDNKVAVSASARLLPTKKKYIIEISRESYDLLRQSTSH